MLFLLTLPQNDDSHAPSLPKKPSKDASSITLEDRQHVCIRYSKYKAKLICCLICFIVFDPIIMKMF